MNMECSHDMGAIRRHDEEAFRKYGWYAHIVPDDAYPLGLNYHTHGMPESYGHQDIQVVLPIDPGKIHRIVSDIVWLVKDGRKFHAGEIAEGVIKGLNVSFVEAEESGRMVLRLILPDKNGELLASRMDREFAGQYLPYGVELDTATDAGFEGL